MIEEILDQCLQDLRDHRATIADCLKRYPQQANELEPLLNTAKFLRAVPNVTPSAAFKSRTRAQLLELTRPPSPRRFGYLFPRWSYATAATIVLTLLVLGSSLVYAAADSLPNSPLYVVKRNAEAMQLFLASDPESQARIHMTLAEHRLIEAQMLTTSSEQSGLAEQSIDEYGEQVDASLAAVPVAQDSTPLMQELIDRLARQESDLRTLERKISAPVLAKATSGLQKAKAKLSSLASPQNMGAPVSVPPASSVPAPVIATSTLVPAVPTASTTLASSALPIEANTPTLPSATLATLVAPSTPITPVSLPTVSEKVTPVAPPISLPTVSLPSVPVQVPGLPAKPNTGGPAPKPPDEKPPVVPPVHLP